jgi:hypothetical protein
MVRLWPPSWRPGVLAVLTSALLALAAEAQIYVSLPGVDSGSAVAPGNPTAAVGLAAINGTAPTFLRSDGAPALSQAITPTWTGAHVWTQPLTIPDGTAAAPALRVTSDTSGLYRSASGQLSVSLLGTQRVTMGSNTMAFLGSAASEFDLTHNTARLNFGATLDTGIHRQAAGLLEVNNGTLGTYRDLMFRTNYMPKITPSGTAPGANACKFEVVAGTNAGTCKLQAICGTSTTPVPILDNIGSGC